MSDTPGGSSGDWRGDECTQDIADHQRGSIARAFLPADGVLTVNRRELNLLAYIQAPDPAVGNAVRPADRAGGEGRGRSGGRDGVQVIGRDADALEKHRRLGVDSVAGAQVAQRQGRSHRPAAAAGFLGDRVQINEDRKGRPFDHAGDDLPGLADTLGAAHPVAVVYDRNFGDITYQNPVAKAGRLPGIQAGQRPLNHAAAVRPAGLVGHPGWHPVGDHQAGCQRTLIENGQGVGQRPIGARRVGEMRFPQAELWIDNRHRVRFADRGRALGTGDLIELVADHRPICHVANHHSEGEGLTLTVIQADVTRPGDHRPIGDRAWPQAADSGIGGHRVGNFDGQVDRRLAAVGDF